MAVYRTFWALLDLVDPSRFLRLEDEKLALETYPELGRAPSHTRCMCRNCCLCTTLRGGCMRDYLDIVGDGQGAPPATSPTCLRALR